MGWDERVLVGWIPHLVGNISPCGYDSVPKLKRVLVQWGNSEISKESPFKLDKYISRERFEDILDLIRYTDNSAPSYKDDIFEVNRRLDFWITTWSKYSQRDVYHYYRNICPIVWTSILVSYLFIFQEIPSTL